MSSRRVSVQMVSNAEGFRRRLALAAEALGARLALDSATWEPHDWSTFDEADG